MGKIDLHLHTNNSDGSLSNKEVISLALQNNCSAIAITDHDFASSEIQENNSDIEIINGIEFNTTVTNMHILGYGILNPQELNYFLKRIKFQNELVTLKVINLLQNDGYDISEYKVIKYLAENNFNYNILDKRKLVKYLIYKHYVSDVLSAYQNLIGLGQKYYVPNKKIKPQEVIRLINRYKGVSILAHPNILNLSIQDLKSTILDLKDLGLMGVEVENLKMNLAYSNDLALFCLKNNLLITKGSDFHDPRTDKIGLEDDREIYKKLKLKIGERHNNC